MLVGIPSYQINRGEITYIVYVFKNIIILSMFVQCRSLQDLRIIDIAKEATK